MVMVLWNTTMHEMLKMLSAQWMEDTSMEKELSSKLQEVIETEEEIGTEAETAQLKAAEIETEEENEVRVVAETMEVEVEGVSIVGGMVIGQEIVRMKVEGTDASTAGREVILLVSVERGEDQAQGFILI